MYAEASLLNGCVHFFSFFPEVSYDIGEIMNTIREHDVSAFYGQHFGFHYGPKMRRYVRHNPRAWFTVARAPVSATAHGEGQFGQ
jgi:hypothetical protein